MYQEFSWNNFDVRFLYAVVNSYKTPLNQRKDTHNKDVLVSKISDICDYPDQYFVEKYKQEIDSDFLALNAGIAHDAFRLKAGDKHEKFIYDLVYNTKLTKSIVEKYLRALHIVGGGDLYLDCDSDFKYTRTGNLLASKALEPIDLYDFQEKAYDDLKKFYIIEGKQNGFLIMPTGSGKTRTTVAFLLQEMVAKGYQVVWLTHRHMLIDQTAQTFWEYYPAIKLFNKKKKTFQITCVSGQHQGMYAINKDNDVMVLSNFSANLGLRFFKGTLKEKVIIVVDEAHHSVSTTYRHVIDHIRSIRPNTKLLGLTATPVRVNKKEEAYLHNMYAGNVVSSVSMSDLVAKGVLAFPKFERVDTRLCFESDPSGEEMKALKAKKDLPPTMVKKIINAKKRNSVIVNKYLEKRAEYGKTLIFAVNQVHAATLAEELRRKGVKADAVYSSNGKELNADIINKFKNNALEVLVNVNILTEGSDIPDIHAVFLTRPTVSKALVMQMIGRGMRGGTNGTKDVIIVDFHDQWNIFNQWINPELAMRAELTELEEAKTKKDYELVFTPWESIFKAYDSLEVENAEQIALASRLSLPKGWYSLEDNGKPYKLIVYDDQYATYRKIRSDREKLMGRAFDTSPTGLVKYYFNNFISKPSDKDLEVFWRNLREASPMPFYELKNKDEYEPLEVALRCREQKLNVEQVVDDVYSNHPVVEAAYGNYDSYYSYVNAAYEYLRNGMKHPHKYTIEEMPLSDIPFKIDKPYDINELYNEVIKEQFDGVDEGIKYIRWTTRPMKSYYGVYDSVQHTIEINVLLNSSMVKREAVKYVIYHELLHRDNLSHDRAFRKLEALYPDSTNLERHLKYELFNNYKFDF